ncbi:MAG: hypothetical protein J5797_07515 [Prevotella sp.]|nr:hypothetical protein [Prevotella sp.]
MKGSIIEKEFLGFLNVDALIRIKDKSGFFDKNQNRLKALLFVANNCEAKVSHVGIEPDIIITFSNLNSIMGSPTEKRHSYEPFYREVIRIGLLLEKFIMLVDSKAIVEIDYPSKKILEGRAISSYDEFMNEPSEKSELSTVIPESIVAKVDSFIALVIPPQNYKMGTCHWIWNMKKTILRYCFGFNWKTPSERNPHIFYD